MQLNKTDILIIGGGLTGLTIAYLLRQSKSKVVVVEARDRVGGRIHTVHTDSAVPLEMGATWLGNKHTALVHLLKELNIHKYEQRMGDKAIYEVDGSTTQLIPIPYNPDPSYRIEGGSSHLIHTLAKQIGEEKILTAQMVTAIEKEKVFFKVKTNTNTFQAKIVISTLPPFLLMETIAIQPALPEELISIAKDTHTWMGESIKVGLSYAQPFWREKVGTGTIFSNVGPINEMYDHSSQADTKYGLKGFINSTYFTATKEQRLAAILQQLQKYFGAIVHDYLSYEETVWHKESTTYTPYGKYLFPHQNNGHPIYQTSYLDGHFFVAGSETAKQYAGYMDGAVRSAYFVYQEIAKLENSFREMDKFI